jgi:hypothetical protein
MEHPRAVTNNTQPNKGVSRFPGGEEEKKIKGTIT